MATVRAPWTSDPAAAGSVARRAGRMPQSRPVTIDSITAEASTRAFIAVSPIRGTSIAVSVGSRSMTHAASSEPSAPAASESIRLSTIK